MPHSYTEDQLKFLEVLQAVGGSLSILGTSFIIITYKLVPSVRTYSMKLVLSLIVADFFFAVANVMSWFRANEISCNIEGFIRTASLLSSALWAAIISYTSYSQIKSFDPDMPRKYPFLLASNILVSLLPALP